MAPKRTGGVTVPLRPLNLSQISPKQRPRQPRQIAAKSPGRPIGRACDNSEKRNGPFPRASFAKVQTALLLAPEVVLRGFAVTGNRPRECVLLAGGESCRLESLAIGIAPRDLAFIVFIEESSRSIEDEPFDEMSTTTNFLARAPTQATMYRLGGSPDGTGSLDVSPNDDQILFATL
ncbi:MAG: hypothetical protein KDB27_12635 [Planctomycetales bacterium]|nr:hypothetical protein [Planctomycetales bacterium]